MKPRILSLFMTAILFTTISVGCNPSSTPPPDEPEFADFGEIVEDFTYDVPDEYALKIPLSEEDVITLKIASFCVDYKGTVYAATHSGHVLQIALDGTIEKTHEIGVALLNLTLTDKTLQGRTPGFHESAKLFELDLDSGKSQKIEGSHDAPDFTDYDPVHKGGYVFTLQSEGTIHRVKEELESPSEEQIVLNINISQRGLQWIDSGLYKEYADSRGIKINYINGFDVNKPDNHWDLDKLTVEWMSGAGNIDGAIITADIAIGMDFVKRGAYLPITGYVSDEFYGKTFDWITDIAKHDNGYWMTPRTLDAQKIYYNPEKMAEFGLSTDIFDTYESMWETAVSLLSYRKDENRNNVIIGGWLYPMYSKVYPLFQSEMQSEPNFSTPEFHTALEYYLRWHERSNTSIENRYFNWHYLESSHYDFVFNVSFDFSAFRDTSPISDEVFTLYDNLRILPIPNEYDTPNVISVMEVLIINPATKHTEEMLALAEHMMTEAMNPVRDSWTDPQLSTMFFKDKSVYQNVYNKDSEQFDDLYRFYSNCYVPIIPTDLYSYINELAFGNATIDETVFAIDRYMKMRWRESQ